MSYWWLVVAMTAITFLMRYSLFAWPNLSFPPVVRQALHYVPTAVLTAIVVPGMLLPDGEHWHLSFDNAYLLAGLAAIGIAAWSRNLLATIGGGLVVFFALRWALGQI